MVVLIFYALGSKGGHNSAILPCTHCALAWCSGNVLGLFYGGNPVKSGCGDSFLFKALIRKQTWEALFRFYNWGLGKEAWECHAEKRLGSLLAS